MLYYDVLISRPNMETDVPNMQTETSHRHHTIYPSSTEIINSDNWSGDHNLIYSNLSAAVLSPLEYCTDRVCLQCTDGSLSILYFTDGALFSLTLEIGIPGGW